MNIVSIKKSPRVTAPIFVTVNNVEPHTDAEIIDFALDAARESRGSLFGIYLDFHPSKDQVLVSLMRD